MNISEADIFDPFIIAEIGVNHEGSIELAKEMISSASEAGAHAVKFQAYKAEKIASKDAMAYWDTKKEKTLSQQDLFKKYDTFNREDYEVLFEYSKKNKIHFSSTAFDLLNLNIIDPLVKFHKIASADITNIPMIRAISKKKKPIILSTGASNDREIQKAIDEISKKNKNICLLHCVLNYPTKDEDANLERILHLKSKFSNFKVGYSDHTVPNTNGCLALKKATMLGSVILEKHYTNDKKLKGNDHYHSMDYKDLKDFVSWVSYNKKMVLRNSKTKKNIENMARINARRRIYSYKNISKGDTLTDKNIIPLRSNIGIEVAEWDRIIGKKINKSIDAGTAILSKMIIKK